MQRIKNKTLLGVSDGFHDKASHAAARPFVSENTYPSRITKDPPGIVKRKRRRDNFVGVETGFRARKMAYWPSAHVYLRRESA